MNAHLQGCIAALILFLSCTSVYSQDLKVADVPLPGGFVREAALSGSFGSWLRNLRLKPLGTPVRLFDGSLKSRQDVHYAVIDKAPGNRDLQQCADALMRLRSEYLFSRGDIDRIQFTLGSGLKFPYGLWAKGYRLKVIGNNASLVKTAPAGSNPEIFQEYLTMLYAYAGTLSLEKDVKKPNRPTLNHGDIFLKGGSPGHGVMVLDVAKNPKTGEVIFLLAQSYMPAQDIHILKNPESSISPWYTFRSAGTLVTPEWRFDFGDRRIWD